MKKKLMLIALMCAVVSLAFAGGKAESAGGVKSVNLSLNHVGATDHPYQAGSVKFAELLKQYSGGSITVDVFPASQIASGAKAIEYVQAGTLDIAL